MTIAVQSYPLLLWSDHHQLYQSDVLILTQGLIPGGESVVFNGVTSTSYTWVVNVSAGTNMLFSMTDSQSNTGGVSPLELVSASNDASCLVTNSPSSTSSAPSSTIGSASSTSSAS